MSFSMEIWLRSFRDISWRLIFLNISQYSQKTPTLESSFKFINPEKAEAGKLPSGFSENVSSNIIIKYVLPESLFQKIWRLSLSILAVFNILLDCKNCIKLYWYYISSSWNMKGAQDSNWPSSPHPTEKTTLKKPSLIRLVNNIKKRLQHRYFCVNIVKFSRIAFLQYTASGCFSAH